MDDVIQPETDPSQKFFYQCICPECGSDDLTYVDFGFFSESDFMGFSNGFETGVLKTRFLCPGEDNLMIQCKCGQKWHEYESIDDDDWVRSNCVPRRILPFKCPQCGSEELYQIEIIDFKSPVLAACEPDASGENPLIAVGYIRMIYDLEDRRPGPLRYRCSEGHELTKYDGSAVETAQELIDWLKAHQPNSQK